jgi:hypothetical protein
MATQVTKILQAAIDSSTANDGGASPIANNIPELIGVLDRKVKQVYALVALPGSRGGSAEGDFFKTTWTVTIGTPSTSLVALPAAPVIAFIQAITDTSGNWVSVVSYRDLLDGLAEFAPAVVILDQKLRSCARFGDPVSGDVLTILGNYLPATLTSLTDYIGATAAADPATTSWPTQAGDPFLVSFLGLYLAMKDGTRDPSEIQHYQTEMQTSASILADLLGVNAAALVTTSDE